MSDILNHAITVRDVLYFWLACFSFLLLLIVTGAVWLQHFNKARDREREILREQIRKDYADAAPFPTRFDNDGQPIYHLRNPAFGIPQSGLVKWQEDRPYTTD